MDIDQSVNNRRLADISCGGGICRFIAPPATCNAIAPSLKHRWQRLGSVRGRNALGIKRRDAVRAYGITPRRMLKQACRRARARRGIAAARLAQASKHRAWRTRKLAHHRGCLLFGACGGLSGTLCLILQHSKITSAWRRSCASPAQRQHRASRHRTREHRVFGALRQLHAATLAARHLRAARVCLRSILSHAHFS
jgi:hypothetical protein